MDVFLLLFKAIQRAMNTIDQMHGEIQRLQKENQELAKKLAEKE